MLHVTPLNRRIVMSFTSIYWIIILIVGSVNRTTATDVPVQTKVGTIVGFEDYVLIDRKVEKVTKFLGIPYAENSTGVNRFEKPVPKAYFNDTFYAKTYPPSCYFMYADKNSKGLSEDCLALNVYVPGSITEHDQVSLPVMIWVYGGSFVWGSSKTYKAEALSAFGNVIVITINYRLEMFGFLRSSNGKLIGNQGLWDQHLAFKWVHDNIRSFHGDRNNVTIFGESSGGVSVMLHALYPGNAGLFQRVIAESGTAFEYWSVYEANADKIISQLSCNHGDPVTCLKQKSALEIQSVQWLVNYGPVVDGEFLVEKPTDIVFGNSSTSASARSFFASLDILTGMCQFDGALYLLDIWPFKEAKSKENISVTEDLFSDTIIPKFVDDVYGLKTDPVKNAVIKAIKVEYTNLSDPNNDDRRRENVLKMTSEGTFYAAQFKTVQGHSTLNKRRTYFFEFALNTTTHLWSQPPSWAPVGSYHGDEIPYVFGYPISNATDPVTYTSTEKQVSRAVMTMWTNFAKSGDPNKPVALDPYFRGSWPVYSIATPSYLSISESIAVGSTRTGFSAQRMTFWLQYIPQLIKRMNDGFPQVIG